MLKLFKWCSYISVLIISETWYNVALLNVTVANEAVVKHVNCIWEMSQNDEYFNRRGVTKCSCGCKSIFHFDNDSWAAAAAAWETFATGGKATGKHMHNMGRLGDDAKWKLDWKACVNGSTLSSFGNISLEKYAHTCCSFIIILLFILIITAYLLKLFRLVTVPPSDTIALSRTRHVWLTSIYASMWYLDIISLYWPMTIPKCSAQVCSCIV